MTQAFSQADFNKLKGFVDQGADGLAGYYNFLASKGGWFVHSFLLFLSLLFLFSSLAFAAEEKKVHFQMGDYEYAIPEAYFDVPVQKGCASSGALLRLILPDFSPVTQENWPIYSQVGQFGKGGEMLLNVNDGKFKGQPLKFIEMQMNVYMESFAPEKLEMPYPYYGLKVYTAEVSKNTLRKNRPFSGEQVFANYDNKGNLHGFIGCRIPGSGNSPNCQHFLTINDLVVKVTYMRIFLPQWKRIEQTAKDLIKDWTIKKVEKALPACCEHIGCER